MNDPLQSGNEEQDQPIYKKWAFWLGIFIVTLYLLNLYSQPSKEELRQELAALAAISQQKKEQAATEAKQRADETARLSAWKTDLTLKYIAYRKGGFGGVGLHDFSVRNKSKVNYWKDLQLKITYYGASGTELNSNVETLYQAVPPGKTIRKREFNAGFINSQADKARVELVGATPI